MRFISLSEKRGNPGIILILAIYSVCKLSEEQLSNFFLYIALIVHRAVALTAWNKCLPS